MLIEAWQVKSTNGRQTAYYLEEQDARNQSDIRDVASITHGEFDIKEADIIELNKYHYLVL